MAECIHGKVSDVENEMLLSGPRSGTTCKAEIEGVGRGMEDGMDEKHTLESYWESGTISADNTEENPEVRMRID